MVLPRFQVLPQGILFYRQGIAKMNLTKHQILNQLDQFTGTQYYYPLWPKVMLTDGTKYLAETVGCYWLMDSIASHILHLPKKETFAGCMLVKLKQRTSQAAYSLYGLSSGLYALICLLG